MVIYFTIERATESAMDTVSVMVLNDAWTLATASDTDMVSASPLIAPFALDSESEMDTAPSAIALDAAFNLATASDTDMDASVMVFEYLSLLATESDITCDFTVVSNTLGS